jgi:hypothetical protein
LGNRATFSHKTYFAEGRPWWEWHQVSLERLKGSIITFAFVATHNHFNLERGGKVFNRSAPVIKLPAAASEADYLGLLGLLNSSAACFWIKQVCHNKGGQGVNEGAKAEAWERFIELTATRLEAFPLPAERPLDLARALDKAAQRLSATLPGAICARTVPTREELDRCRLEAQAILALMIGLQEELDWRSYRLYRLIDDPPEHSEPPPLHLGERAFEIALARSMAAGDLGTAWFERHRSTPITELPNHWPADYSAVVERRIALIESNPTIGLIEQPEYKRRWSVPSWEESEREALRTWLLDKVESARFWRASDPHILSTRALADAMRQDSAFLSVVELYAGRAVFDFDALVTELITSQSVPLRASLYRDGPQETR